MEEHRGQRDERQQEVHRHKGHQHAVIGQGGDALPPNAALACQPRAPRTSSCIVVLGGWRPRHPAERLLSNSPTPAQKTTDR